MDSRGQFSLSSCAICTNTIPPSAINRLPLERKNTIETHHVLFNSNVTLNRGWRIMIQQYYTVIQIMLQQTFHDAIHINQRMQNERILYRFVSNYVSDYCNMSHVIPFNNMFLKCIPGVASLPHVVSNLWNHIIHTSLLFSQCRNIWLQDVSQNL